MLLVRLYTSLCIVNVASFATWFFFVISLLKRLY
jgi:hypothetical protein